jgi:peptidoglycan/xylan/chitin deacetylase (PgdA/CDA1 family)
MRAMTELIKEAIQACLCPHGFLWRLPANAGCALTFDDGPDPEHTPRILDLLHEHDIRATFFVLGRRVREAPWVLRRLAEEGHAIGSHTYSHSELPKLTRDELWRELNETRRAIFDLTGIDTALLRPPRGRVSMRSLLILNRWGYHIVHWSKTYSDYLRDGCEPLLRRIHSRTLVSGDIALFHDNNDYTLEALRVMLPQWRHALRFVALSPTHFGATV